MTSGWPPPRPLGTIPRRGFRRIAGCSSEKRPQACRRRSALAHYDRCLRLPMREEARSLNLSNSVAILTYEALRQNGFPGLCGTGR